MTAIVPLPPPWLDGEDFPLLNSWFYKVEPHSYFDARLGLLIAHAGRPELLGQVIRDGVQSRGLKGGGKSGIGEEDDESGEFGTTDEELHLHFVTERMRRAGYVGAEESAIRARQRLRRTRK